MAKKNPTPPSNPQGGIVNVIFRGLFIYVQRRDKKGKPSYLEVVMPNVGEEHVYRAGGFLQQTTLGPSMYPYGITRISGGNATFDAERNVVLNGMKLAANLTPEQVYARFVLPQPFEIHSLCTTTPIVAAVDPLHLFDGRRMSAVQLFRYRAEDLAQVRLFPHRYELLPHTTPAGNFLNLHVSNDEDFEQADGHSGFAIDRMFDLIPCLHCKVRLAHWADAPKEYKNLAALGLVEEELFSSRELHQRTIAPFVKELRGRATVSPPQGCVGNVLDFVDS